MNSVKCVHCGLVDWAGAEACKRCGNPPQGEWQPSGQEFGGWQQQAAYGGQGWDVKKRKGLAVASLVVGVISFFTLGLLGVGALTGLIMGIVALSRANRQPNIYGGRGLAIGGIVASALSIVMVVPIAIIAAIAIPNLLASRRAANEAHAVYQLRKFVHAEAVYSSTTGGGEFGTPEDLLAEELIEDGVFDGSRSGYAFRATTSPEGCEASAVPTAYGQTGNRSFYITCDEAEVHGADKRGRPADADDPVIRVALSEREAQSFFPSEREPGDPPSRRN